MHSDHTTRMRADAQDLESADSGASPALDHFMLCKSLASLWDFIGKKCTILGSGRVEQEELFTLVTLEMRERDEVPVVERGCGSARTL